MKKIILGLIILFLVSPFTYAQSSSMKAIVNTVTMTDADTEYSWAIPNGAGSFTVQCRNGYDIKICFTSGESGTTYFTIKTGSAYYETNVSSYGNTLYFQCAAAGQVLEIVYWY